MHNKHIECRGHDRNMKGEYTYQAPSSGSSFQLSLESNIAVLNFSYWEVLTNGYAIKNRLDTNTNSTTLVLPKKLHGSIIATTNYTWYFQDLSSNILQAPKFLNFQLVNPKKKLQSFSDSIAGWSKEPQWENNYGCFFGIVIYYRSSYYVTYGTLTQQNN